MTTWLYKKKKLNKCIFIIPLFPANSTPVDSKYIRIINELKGEQKKTSFFKKNRYFSIFCFTITTTLYITIFTRSLPWQLAGLSFWSEPAVLQQLSQSVSHIDPQFWPFEPMTSLWKFSVPPLFVDLWPWLLLLKMPRHFL